MTTSLAIFIERMGFMGVGTLAGYVLGHMFGRDAGVKAERLRIEHAFDIAFGTVKSGALIKVYRRITGKYTADELRTALIREVEGREKEREFRRRFG